ncbi:MAG: hypothetical protein RR253_02700 [Oscillospiraceae bacterium]
MTNITFKNNQEIELLCSAVRSLLKHNEFSECESLISQAMCKFPHSPEPHNLFGVVFAKEGRHPEAMKHFKAACALDPGYAPARCNMEYYGNFYFKGQCAIDQSDCNFTRPDGVMMEYDHFGVEHLHKSNFVG